MSIKVVSRLSLSLSLALSLTLMQKDIQYEPKGMFRIALQAISQWVVAGRWWATTLKTTNLDARKYNEVILALKIVTRISILSHQSGSVYRIDNLKSHPTW